MNFALLLFLIGILGFVLNRKNIILMLISIEIMLLAITFLILVSSLSFDDILGQTWAIYIIAIAGAESAIGLGILVAFYRFYSSNYIKLCRLFNVLTVPGNVTVRICHPLQKPTLAYKKIRANCRLYSTKIASIQPKITKNSGLDPWFVTGFTDAEGSFVCSVRKRVSSRVGWRTEAIFIITLHIKDVELLKLLQTYFGGIGNIRKHGKDSCAFVVSSLEQITKIIIPHFYKYPMITNKRADYLLWREIILKMGRREHLMQDGLQAIVNLRASMNWGLREELIAAFPRTIPVKRPVVVGQVIPHSLWLAGFSSGEGCFFVKIGKATTRIGFQVVLLFELTQHSRDEKLMESLIEYFGCGRLAKTGKDVVRFKVVKFSDITEKIIPFFCQHQIIGVKSLDFSDWCRVAEIMQARGDKTLEGLDEIRKIKAGMNQKRSATNE
jgi:NADH:ubiquinone oxidoreductase subunit K